MDLVSGAKRTIVTMLHENKGHPKIVNRCMLPVTGEAVVDMVITELAVFTFPKNQITLTEVAEGYTVDEIRARTDCKFAVSPNLKTFN